MIGRLLNYEVSTTTQKWLTYRSFRNFNHEEFLHDLASDELQSVSPSLDVDSASELLH